MSFENKKIKNILLIKKRRYENQDFIFRFYLYCYFIVTLFFKGKATAFYIDFADFFFKPDYILTKKKQVRDLNRK